MLKKLFILIIGTITISQLLTSCANITPIEGGPKDTLSPKALYFNPKNNTTNFKGNNIEIAFSEKIEITQLRNEILISPNYGNNLDVKTVNNKLKIAFKDSLLPNTTYIIHFNKGIRDLTEGNTTQNLSYVFSTGPKIDSMQFSGKVKDSYTDKPVSKILVGLYKYEDTLNIKTQKPNYYTYTNIDGSFIIENIKPNKYKAFAIDDNNKNLKFDQKTEKIGFINTTITLTENVENIEMNLVKQNDTKINVQRTNTKDNKTDITFNKSIRKITLQNPNNISCSVLNTEKKIFSIYNLPFTEDSLDIDIVTEDSLDVKTTIHTIAYKEKVRKEKEDKKDKKDLKEKLSNTLISFLPKNGESITEFKEVVINFDKPIFRNKEIKIYYKIDNQNTIELPESQIKFQNQEATIFIKGEIQDSIKITADKGAILTCTGDSLPKLKHINKILKEEEMASLEGTITTKEKQYYIELVNEKGELIQRLNKNNESKFHFPKLKPGNYQIKAVIDINNNGIWDCGNYANGTLPEKNIFLPKIITLKQNWEVKEVNFTF